MGMTPVQLKHKKVQLLLENLKIIVGTRCQHTIPNHVLTLAYSTSVSLLNNKSLTFNPLCYSCETEKN